MDKNLYYRYNDSPDENGKPQHLHELSRDRNIWIPLTGTSGVGNIIAKNLVWWSAELAAVTCLEAGEKIETIRKEYDEACKSSDKKKAIDALQKKYPLFKKARFAHFERLDDTATEGTDTHALCEAYLKSVMAGNPISPTDEKVKKLEVWVKNNVKRVLWSEAYFFSEKFWLGGIGDGGVELNDGRYFALDFKHAKEVYFNNLIQIALYIIQVEENGGFDKDGNNKFVLDKKIDGMIVFPFGAKNLEEILQRQMDKPYSVEEFKQSSLNALELMRHKNKFEQ